VNRLGPGLAAAGVLMLAATLVALTLRPTKVPTYPPTPAAPREVGRALTPPVLYTIDATGTETWRRFAFHLGSVLDGAESWDLAFRRYAIVAGPGAGILDLGEIRFDEVRVVPTAGYLANEGQADPRNPAIASWYSYGFFSHVLTPKPHVWAVRTADGHYAKLEMVGYYCPGSTPGCPTFRYIYQGDGSPNVAPR
jgi:heme-binding HmuY-like protein